MSGELVPYHLRPNKYVERQLFLDLLGLVFEYAQSRNYCYISMGGRFLEDLKAIHARFGLKALVSIEQDSVIVKRQRFNRAFGFIECEQKTSGELVDGFSEYEERYSDQRFAVWLDYASPKERGRQLRELSQLIGKLGSGDVVKITLNASPHSLGESVVGLSADELQKKRFEKLCSQMEDFILEEYRKPEFVTAAQLPVVLAAAVQKAANEGIRAKPRLHVEPLAMFAYQDGNHRMLTVTCVVVNRDEVSKIQSHAGLSQWPFRCQDWQSVHSISVPDLSLKERYLIHEGLLSKTEEEIHDSLPFQLDDNDAGSIEQLRQYTAHYSRYPSFARFME